MQLLLDFQFLNMKETSVPSQYVIDKNTISIASQLRI